MNTPRIGLAQLLGGTGDASALARALGNLLAHRHAQAGGDPAATEAVRASAQAVAEADAQGHACWPVGAGLSADEAAALIAQLQRSPVVQTEMPTALTAQAQVAHTAPPAPASAPWPQTDELSLRPLVLDAQGRLYTQRYWQAECALAARWAQWQCAAPLVDDLAHAAMVLDRWFPRPHAGLDAQRTAVALCLLRPAVVLSGGPGTGKTTTVVRLLAALTQLAPGLEVALVAPTGKAAARMQESVRQQLPALGLDAAAQARLPTLARTVHALLGIGADGIKPRHDHEHPLSADLVIVDEASMLGLMLAARLFDALKPGARVLLVGDHHQLASVESGIVLATLARTQSFSAATAQALAALGAPVAPEAVDADDDAALGSRDAVIWLTHSHRFAAAGPIARLALAIHGGEAAEVLAALHADDGAENAEVQAMGAGDVGALVDAALAGYAPYLDAVRAAADPAAAFAAFERYRLLCAMRVGARGSVAVSAAIDQRVRAALEVGANAGWYHGRAVIVTRNDAALGVFNGDIGVCWATPGAGLRVHLRRPDGHWRTVAPARLDACEDAWALTIHKSQGSEFDAVDVVLPERPTRLVVRELIYTAVTRPRKRLRVWSSDEVLAAGIAARTVRHSGLDARVREAMALISRRSPPPPA